MSEENSTKSLPPKKASLLASALLSAGMVVGGQSIATAAPNVENTYTPVKKNGNINAIYKDHYNGVLRTALHQFNSLPPELAHAYMITRESGWDHWARDKKGNQIIYTGDRAQLPAKNHICDPATLPLVVGWPLPKISVACAIGLAQVIPDTAKSSIQRYSLPYTMSDVLYNPQVNYLTGYLYFMDVRNRLKERFPSFNGLNTLAATGYNMGEGNQKKTFAYYGATPNSSRFDLHTYLATMPIEETKQYVPYILANNGVISQKSVFDDANGSWFNRRVNAEASYQQLRAGMKDFTSYLAQSRIPFRDQESFLGNGEFNIDPSKSDFRVDPSKSTFRVNPSESDFKVTPPQRHMNLEP